MKAIDILTSWSKFFQIAFRIIFRTTTATESNDTFSMFNVIPLKAFQSHAWPEQ